MFSIYISNVLIINKHKPMKKTKSLWIVLVIILSSITSFSQDTNLVDTIVVDTNVYQPMNNVSTPTPTYWRTITLNNMTGMTLSGHLLNTFSVSLDYEIKNGYSISNWSGFNYNWAYDGGWLSSQTTVNKRLEKGFTLGLGMMYNNGSLITPFDSPLENFSIIFTASKRFKLK